MKGRGQTPRGPRRDIPNRAQDGQRRDPRDIARERQERGPRPGPGPLPVQSPERSPNPVVIPPQPGPVTGRIPETALYGRHAVLESLRAGRRTFRRLWLVDGARDAPIVRHIIDAARAAKVPIETAPREAFEAVSSHAQGAALEASDYPYATIDEMFSLAAKRNEKPLLLVLDTLQDPQNLGTLIRSADATGAHGVIIPDRRSATVTPAVVNASSGAVEYLFVAQVVNLAREIDGLKKRDVWIAALQDDPRATNLFTTDLRGGLALIVGNEAEGVGRLLRDKADYVVKLPMRGRIASLNAAAAGTIALYEVLRQRQS